MRRRQDTSLKARVAQEQEASVLGTEQCWCNPSRGHHLSDLPRPLPGYRGRISSGSRFSSRAEVSAVELRLPAFFSVLAQAKAIAANAGYGFGIVPFVTQPIAHALVERFVVEQLFHDLLSVTSHALNTIAGVASE